VQAVQTAAFPTALEAQLVERLRVRGNANISLVAEVEGQVVGHVVFSPVSLNDANESVLRWGLGLAPLAVLPRFQRRGIGALLVREGLVRSRAQQAPFVVVLGETRYYSRFGFAPAAQWNIANEYGAGEEFMILVYDGNAMPAQPSLAKYAAPFAELA
jgi:putative acetyltransferase